MRDVVLPRTLDELWDRLAAWPEDVVFAGGTDLLVGLRTGRAIAPRLICLERVEGLGGVIEIDGWLRLGAGTTHAALLADARVMARAPLLTQALRTLGSPLVRNAGTLGGNICTASPAGDTLPPLYALDAELELATAKTVRRLPISAFIRGPGQTVLAAGEILVAVWVKVPAPALHHFEKVGQRQALSVAIASLAALVELTAQGEVTYARLAFGSVAPTVLEVPEAAAVLVGRRLDRTSLFEAAALVRAAVRPIDDLRASAAYRRQVAGNLLLRLEVYDRMPDTQAEE